MSRQFPTANIAGIATCGSPPLCDGHQATVDQVGSARGVVQDKIYRFEEDGPFWVLERSWILSSPVCTPDADLHCRSKLRS